MGNLKENVVNQLGFNSEDLEKLIEMHKNDEELENSELYCSLDGIYNHGINGGYGGFIYYSDTIDFFKKNREDIKESLLQDVDNFGSASMAEMIQGFNCINDDVTQDSINDVLYSCDENNEDFEHIANGLSWYAGEKITQDIMSELGK